MVNDSGETVLDVSDVPRTDILRDEISGETRLIKTWNPAGTEEIVIDNDTPTEIYKFTFDYYDCQGKLLVKDSEHSLVSLVDEWGLTENVTWGSAVFELSQGKCLGGKSEEYGGNTMLPKRGLPLQSSRPSFMTVRVKS